MSIVERMFQRCFDDGQIHQAIGVALETKRLDKLEEAIHKSTDVAEALNYATRVCQTLVTSRSFAARCSRCWCACTRAITWRTTT